MNEEPNVIVEVEIMKDGMTARDIHGNVYKIESISLGAGSHRHTIKWEKNFLKDGSECRGQVLNNGKLNIQ